MTTIRQSADCSRMDTIQRLLEEVSALVDSPRNRALQALYEPPAEEMLPAHALIPRSCQVDYPERVPCQAYLSYSLWSRILGFDLNEFFRDPEAYIENLLRIWIFQFNEIQDDTPLYRKIPLWLGAGFEASWYGLPVVYVPGQAPWIGKKPLLEHAGDVDRLGEPDFYSSGLMPFALHFFERARELVETAGFTVGFPIWFCSPYGLALHLTGMQNFLMDLLLDPEGCHRLLGYLTDHHKRWFTAKAEYLGRPVGKMLCLGNDEVGAPMLSPALYRDFVLPYEKELCLFHGGHRYWHSCGNITPFLSLIRELPTIDMLHKSDWTDLREAARVFAGTPLEVCLNPAKDVALASPEEMRSKLEKIFRVAEESQVIALVVNQGGLEPFMGPEKDLNQAKMWVEVSRQVRARLAGGHQGMTILCQQR